MRAAALVIALALSGCGAAPGEGHPQLAASVQQRLDILGFGAVDASSLSLSQLGALHLQLQGRAMAVGINRLDTRQKVKAILRQG